MLNDLQLMSNDLQLMSNEVQLMSNESMNNSQYDKIMIMKIMEENGLIIKDITKIILDYWEIPIIKGILININEQFNENKYPFRDIINIFGSQYSNEKFVMNGSHNVRVYNTSSKKFTREFNICATSFKSGNGFVHVTYNEKYNQIFALSVVKSNRVSHIDIKYNKLVLYIHIFDPCNGKNIREYNIDYNSDDNNYGYNHQYKFKIAINYIDDCINNNDELILFTENYTNVYDTNCGKFLNRWRNKFPYRHRPESKIVVLNKKLFTTSEDGIFITNISDGSQLINISNEQLRSQMFENAYQYFSKQFTHALNDISSIILKNMINSKYSNAIIVDMIIHNEYIYLITENSIGFNSFYNNIYLLHITILNKFGICIANWTNIIAHDSHCTPVPSSSDTNRFKIAHVISPDGFLHVIKYSNNQQIFKIYVFQ